MKKLLTALCITLMLLSKVCYAAEVGRSITVDGVDFTLDPPIIEMTMIDGNGDLGFSTTITPSIPDSYGFSRYGYGEGLPTYAILGISSGGAWGNKTLNFSFVDSVLNTDGTNPKIFSGQLPIHIYHGSERGGEGEDKFLFLQIKLTVLPSGSVDGPSLTISHVVTNLTYIAGERQVEAGGMWLDATASSEDIRVVVAASDYTVVDGAPDVFNNVALYTTNEVGQVLRLTTGVHLANPIQSGVVKHTIDGTGFIVRKGTKQFVSRVVDIATKATGGTYTWNVPEAPNYFVAFGLSSAQTAEIKVIREGGTEIKAVQSGQVILNRSTEDKVISEGRHHRVLTIDLETDAVEGGFRAGQVVLGLNYRPMRTRASVGFLVESLIPTMRVSGVTQVSAFVPNSKGGHAASFSYPRDKYIDGRVTIAFEVSETFEPSLLHTGDEIEAWVEYISPLTGATSGFRVELDTNGLRHTTVIRRTPWGACGDVNYDGKVNVDDLRILQDLVSRKVGVSRELDLFPDGKLNELDTAMLQAYLSGAFLTLPLGDVNYDWRLTTSDISYTRRHILGVQPFRNFQFTQADMNRNREVTTLDIMLMRRWILGIH